MKFIGTQFAIKACPGDCIAHFYVKDNNGNQSIQLLSLDNCEFIIEELQKIIEKKVSAVPSIQPSELRKGAKNE